MEEMEMSFRLGIAVSSKVGSETHASWFTKPTGQDIELRRDLINMGGVLGM